MIEVLKAPPFATVQDLGWRIGRAIGLPEGGAMDRRLLEEANALVGNPADRAGLEWALGPGVLRLFSEATCCVLRDAEVRIDGRAHPVGLLRADPGATIEIVPRNRDRFLYLAVRGGIDVPRVMGSRSTYLPGALGGLEGRRIKTGDRLPIGAMPPQAEPLVAGGMATSGANEPKTIRVTRGPQWDRFDAAAHHAFFAGEYVVTPASDRMGYRLSGPPVHPRESATLPSEAACPGAVQIPDSGEPIVLMRDGPTVGGYPKMVVVIRADLGMLAQCPPGRAVRFREVSLEDARALRS